MKFGAFNYDPKKVNLWAKKSCPRYNEDEASRKQYREMYQDIADEWLSSSEGRKITQAYEANASLCINTYSQPYRNPKFPGFQQSRNQVVDPSGFPIRSCESYCADKIHQETGAWPQPTSETKFNATNWQKFLAEAGYFKTVSKPKKKHHYVGISVADKNVVWFEHVCDEPNSVKVSTYDEEIHKTKFVNTNDYIWIEIR